MSLPLRVLLVEDSEADATLLTGALRGGGYDPHWRRVDTANALAEALAAEPWDIAVCDWVVPALGAGAAVRVIAESGLDLPIIVVSGSGDEALPVRAIRAGASDFAGKHELARLAPAVARTLREAEARRDAEAALRRAEKKCRDLEEAYQTLADGALESILITQDGRIVFANRAIESVVGVSPAELVGMSLVDALGWFVLADDRAGILAGMASWQPGQGAARQREVRLRRHDGTVRWVLAFTSELMYEGRLATQIVFADVTPHREAEDALRQLNAELEERVRERTALLEAAAKEMESFSYSVSHDLRSPLRSIDAFAEAVLEDAGDVLPPACRDYLGRMRAAARRMGDLIDKLLSFSRLTRAGLHCEPVDLSALATEAAEEIARAQPERSVDLSIAEGLGARADGPLLRAVLANLLGNAWKFTRTRPYAHVEVGRLDGVEPPVYFVRDNGVGFDMAYADKLFCAFQRLHSHDEFEGSGIGLATVQRIIERHGGRVWVEAEVDKGATFYFTLAA